MIHNSLSKRLKYFRNKKKLSVKEIAAAIEVPVTTYREWEHGRSILGEPYEKIAEALGVTLEELITGKSPAHSEIINQCDEIQNRLASLRKNLVSYHK
jgi:transcriptional regulator with XRE-family HTH domain